MLGSPEFAELQWTSLQPNIFTPISLAAAVEFVKHFRQTGKQSTLHLNSDENALVGLVHPDDVGHFAAVLLSQEDHSVHNKAKYVLNGPEDITGKQIVEMVEECIGAKVEDVQFRDVSPIDAWAAAVKEHKNHILSVKHAPVTAWEGKCSAATTSTEVHELAAPKITPAAWFKTAFESSG
jgi:nucleoside-diphosphate-sugar epimerase